MNQNNTMLMWDILPNVGIGQFHILDRWDKVIDYLKAQNIEYFVKKNRTYYSIVTNNIRVSFNKNQQIFAISVFNNFQGKINGCVGLGSTLKDVKDCLGEYVDGLNPVYPTYELAVTKGVEFKLSDDSSYDDINDDIEWDETAVPIVEITVWNDQIWLNQIEI